MPKKLVNFVFVLLGFLLSPLSWWNDLLVNIPLSYALALPFTLINRSLFLPVFIVNYWLTNIAGMLMMHLGINNLAENKMSLNKKEIYKNIALALLYTILIAILFKIGFIALPTFITADK